ncbi:MAG: hypothetical protein GON13_04020 [Nanoarchaeota archaeon]|nr:hypothetical protein [Nanoarchaeota archaeon]
MKKLAYTFRTCPIKADFVFGKIKQDLENFYELILNKKPDIIIGYGNGEKNCFEKYAINVFHGKKIVKNGPDKYELFTPTKSNPKPTTSFCNYTTYKIKYFLSQNELNSKLVFKHLKK